MMNCARSGRSCEYRTTVEATKVERPRGLDYDYTARPVEEQDLC